MDVLNREVPMYNYDKKSLSVSAVRCCRSQDNIIIIRLVHKLIFFVC